MVKRWQEVSTRKFREVLSAYLTLRDEMKEDSDLPISVRLERRGKLQDLERELDFLVEASFSGFVPVKDRAIYPMSALLYNKDGAKFPFDQDSWNFYVALVDGKYYVIVDD